MPILDHCGKLVVGHALGESADIELALKAWRKAASTFRRYGQKLKGIIIHHDQDSVYTSHRWFYDVVIKCEARVSYSENGAKGNVYTESFNSRFKSGNRLLFWEQEDFESLEKVVTAWIRYYNQIRRHSALGNKSPIQYYLKEKDRIHR
jgi:putative transposase